MFAMRILTKTDKWGTSEYSPDLHYRWSLEDRWGEGPLLCWIGLNPGTGDTNNGPRPTLRKVKALAHSLGMGGVVVVNLFAYRSASLQALRLAAVAEENVIGDQNDEAIRKAVHRSKLTLAAWGAGGRLLDRGATVSARVPDMVCLGVTKHGEPRHPLYLPTGGALTPYSRNLCL